MADDGFKKTFVAFRPDMVEASGEYRDGAACEGSPISSMAWMTPQWAAASVPNAPPDTMRCPARAACLASSCALCLPYSLTPRDPTTPIGSGHDTNACGLPCPQRHNGAAQSVYMVRSASCEGQQMVWCDDPLCAPYCEPVLELIGIGAGQRGQTMLPGDHRTVE